MTLGEKIQTLRKKEGWTQEELAEKMQVSGQALSKWESNTVIPDTQNVLQLSELFGVSTDYLLKDKYENIDMCKTTENVSLERNKQYRWQNIVGIIMLIMGLLGILTLRICASLKPAVAYIDDVVKTGLWGFLEVYDLNWLFALCVWFLVLSVLGIMYPKSLEFLKKLRKRVDL